MTDSLDVFLNSTDPLAPTNAAAAILMLNDGRYVMQLRDPEPRIFYPGQLREGRAYAAFTPREVLTELKVAPYDSFANWTHHARAWFKSGADRMRSELPPRQG